LPLLFTKPASLTVILSSDDIPKTGLNAILNTIKTIGMAKIFIT